MLLNYDWCIEVHDINFFQNDPHPPQTIEKRQKHKYMQYMSYVVVLHNYSMENYCHVLTADMMGKKYSDPLSE